MIRRVSGIAAVLLLGSSTPVAAHQIVGRLESPLPLAAYLAGAATAVGLSFVFVLARGVRPIAATPAPWKVVPRWLRLGVRALGLICWAWIVVQAVVGGSSDADVGSLFLWTYGWVGLAIASALVGPIWRWLDPFTTLFDLLSAAWRRLGLQSWERADYPSRWSQWPAAAGLAIFIWIELSWKVNGGQLLGFVLIAYTAYTLVMMAQFGRDPWRANGETFGVWFKTLGRLAPLEAEDPGATRVPRRPFGAGLLSLEWSPARVALVALAVGSVLYDGLSQTRLFFDLFGFPSLLYGTVLLAAFLLGLLAVVFGVARLIGIRPMGAGLLPIAVGYIVAHYLTLLLIDGQRLLIAVSDPFQQGWDLFGTVFMEPSSAWLPPAVVWLIQLSAVVGGHVVGAWAGHAAASEGSTSLRSIRLAQIPLAVLMVLLTATTLWSLGQNVVQAPEDTAALVVVHRAR